MTHQKTPFRGNKAALASKPCAACGLPMSWRKCWAKNWAEVKYCSDACRRAKGPARSAGTADSKGTQAARGFHV